MLDTGVVVRALVGSPGSASSRVVQETGTGAVRLALSDASLTELAEVMRRPRIHQRIRDMVRAFEVALDLGVMGELYRPRRLDWPSVPDPEDSWILDLAWEADADRIVSWDPDLLGSNPPLLAAAVTLAGLLRVHPTIMEPRTAGEGSQAGHFSCPSRRGRGPPPRWESGPAPQMRPRLRECFTSEGRGHIHPCRFSS